MADTAFLCRIWGEDIDHTLTAIVPDWKGVRRFCAEFWTGDVDATNEDGSSTLGDLKAGFDEHEADERGGAYTEEWEIGGISIERICDCSPRFSTNAGEAAPVAYLVSNLPSGEPSLCFEDERGDYGSDTYTPVFEPLFLAAGHGQSASIEHSPTCPHFCAACTTPPAAIPAAPSEAALREAHRLGFLRAAGWMQRDDLFDDVASPAYRKDRDHDLAALAQPAPVQRPTVAPMCADNKRCCTIGNCAEAHLRPQHAIPDPLATPVQQEAAIDERAAFEADYLRQFNKPGRLGPNGSGGYGHLITQARWEGWCSRAALQPTQGAKGGAS